MTGERFKPITPEIKQPTGDEMRSSGFSVASKAGLDIGQPQKRFRFEPQRWIETGGYPPISGGCDANPESELRSLYPCT